ncbi:MAG: hypothetical protein L6V95_04470 [Candidatus Melainabacteria bacterium]|nr:MAG: hypothetical protein L6V95_04470 [Candidatus Melainabacteria bacterium]
MDSDILLTKLEFKDAENVDSLYNSGGQIYEFELSNTKYNNVLAALSANSEDGKNNEQNGANVQNPAPVANGASNTNNQPQNTNVPKNGTGFSTTKTNANSIKLKNKRVNSSEDFKSILFIFSCNCFSYSILHLSGSSKSADCL